MQVIRVSDVLRSWSRRKFFVRKGVSCHANIFTPSLPLQPIKTQKKLNKNYKNVSITDFGPFEILRILGKDLQSSDFFLAATDRQTSINRINRMNQRSVKAEGDRQWSRFSFQQCLEPSFGG